MLVQGYNVLSSSDFSLENLACGNGRNSFLGKDLPAFEADSTTYTMRVEDTYPDKNLGILVVLKETTTGRAYIGAVNDIGEVAIFREMDTGHATGDFDTYDSIQLLKNFLKGAKAFEESKKEKASPFSSGVTITIQNGFSSVLVGYANKIAGNFGGTFGFIKGSRFSSEVQNFKERSTGAIRVKQLEGGEVVIKIDRKFITIMAETLVEFSEEAGKFLVGLHNLFNLKATKSRLKTAFLKAEKRDVELK